MKNLIKVLVGVTVLSTTMLLAACNDNSTDKKTTPANQTVQPTTDTTHTKATDQKH